MTTGGALPSGLGNDATMSYWRMTRDQAEVLLPFIAMLLSVVYEHPAGGKRGMAAREARDQAL